MKEQQFRSIAILNSWLLMRIGIHLAMKGLLMQLTATPSILISATEISRDLGIHRKSVNNFIRKFAEKGIIYMSRKMGNLKYFSVSSNNLENDIYQICGLIQSL